MRVELSSLAETMFYENKEQYLDSKNGRIIDDSLPYEASKHGCLRIPKYSVAYVRQQYMDYMRAHGIIDSAQMIGFTKYPRFNLEKSRNPSAVEAEYISRVHNLCEAIGMESDSYCLPDQVRNHPTYDDFESAKILELAKIWCQENGIDTYNYFDIPCSEEEQKRKEEDERRTWMIWYNRPSSMALYNREDFEHIIDKKIEIMHNEWLEKKKIYDASISTE